MATRITAPANQRRVTEEQVDAALARLNEIIATVYQPLTGSTVATLRAQIDTRFEQVLGMVQDEARYIRALAKLTRNTFPQDPS